MLVDFRRILITLAPSARPFLQEVPTYEVLQGTLCAVHVYEHEYVCTR